MRLRRGRRRVQARAREDRLAERAEVEPAVGGDLRQQAGRRHAGQRVHLEHVLVLALVTSRSTRTAPVQPSARAARSREVEHAAVARRREARGHEVFGHARACTSPRSRRCRSSGAISMAPSTRPSRMPTLTSIAGDEALDDGGVVVVERDAQRARELDQATRPCSTPDARALAARLHDHREAERAVQRLEVGEVVAGGDRVVRRRRHVVQAEHLLGLELVHRQRAREHARARVRDLHELEQALDAAVLAVAAVQREERDVDARARRGSRRSRRRSSRRARRGRRRGHGPRARRRPRCRSGAKPRAPPTSRP